MPRTLRSPLQPLMLRSQEETQEQEEMVRKFAYSMATIWHLKPDELPEEEMQLIERLYNGALEAAGGTTSRAQTMTKRGLPCTHTIHTCMRTHASTHSLSKRGLPRKPSGCTNREPPASPFRESLPRVPF